MSRLRSRPPRRPTRPRRISRWLSVQGWQPSWALPSPARSGPTRPRPASSSSSRSRSSTRSSGSSRLVSAPTTGCSAPTATRRARSASRARSRSSPPPRASGSCSSTRWALRRSPPRRVRPTRACTHTRWATSSARRSRCRSAARTPPGPCSRSASWAVARIPSASPVRWMRCCSASSAWWVRTRRALRRWRRPPTPPRGLRPATSSSTGRRASSRLPDRRSVW